MLGCLAGTRVAGLRHLDAADRAGDRQDPDEHPQCQGQTLPGLPHLGIVGTRDRTVREAGITRRVPRMSDCAQQPGPTMLDPDSHPASGLLGAVRRHPSGILLLAQLLAILAYPFSDGSTIGRAFLGAIGTGVVLIALWAVRRTPALAWVAALIGVPAVMFSIARGGRARTRTGWC